MEARARAVIEVYNYPAGAESEVTPWIGMPELNPAAASEPAPAEPAPVPPPHGAVDENARAQLEQKLVEEAKRSFEAGRQKGLAEGHQAEREAQAAARGAEEARRAEQVAVLIKRFTEERDRYLHAVEHEVVELALAVAARILRREAQMDPLLLTGAVRVALGQLSKTTEVRLLVPQAELDLWTEAIAHIPNLALKPDVIAGEQMRTGDCRIETNLGSVDLGIRSQLGEIERGFFDRAGGATQGAPVAASAVATAAQEAKA